jgi:NADPH-dependent curcumin reductase CurA
MDTTRQIRLKAKPQAFVSPDLFEIVEAPLRPLGEGEALVRTLYLSIDAAMRGWIGDARDGSGRVAVGAVMPGYAIGRVEASRHPGYAPGDVVYGALGWQDRAIAAGADLVHRVDAGLKPLSAALGIFGHTGLAAYVGLIDIGQPRAGETVLVTTAAGGVGSVVGQIARNVGCRVVGITGSDAKAQLCLDELGYDAVVNYNTAANLRAALAVVAPDGIDIFFDTVAGPIAESVFPLLNDRARIVQCGTLGLPPGGPSDGPRLAELIVRRQLRWEGLSVADNFARFPAALEKLREWANAGKLRHREQLFEGLENAPQALVDVIAGRNLGKAVVRVG